MAPTAGAHVVLTSASGDLEFVASIPTTHGDAQSGVGGLATTLQIDPKLLIFDTGIAHLLATDQERGQWLSVLQA